MTIMAQEILQELGVKPETLQTWGAVSAQVAEEMAEGLHRVSGSDLCLSVTGIAGPGGGSAEKPVGLIYIGLWYRGQTSSFRYQLRNSNRRYIRSNAVMHMFLVLYKTLFAAD